MPQKKLANAIVGLLILQFVLGMLANLFSNVPSQKPYVVFRQFGFIAFHALNAVALVVLAIVLLVKLHKSSEAKQAIGGLVNIVLAFIFGELFVFTQRDIFSFLMALAFIGALMSYARIALT